MKTKSYHLTIGRAILGVKNFIYDVACHTNVSIMNFDQSGILLVDYYFTIQGTEEDIYAFENVLYREFRKLEND